MVQIHEIYAFLMLQAVENPYTGVYLNNIRVL